MLFIINPTLAYELAAVADAASTDPRRPVLGRIKLEVEPTDTAAVPSGVILRLVATDSYRLAHREAFVHTNDYVAGANDSKLLDLKDGNVTVVAKEWKKQLKAMATAAKVGNVLIDIEPNAITFGTEMGDVGETTIPLQDIGTFPKYRSLMNEPLAEIEGKLPALNVTYLASIATIVSAKPADREKVPVLLRATGSNGDTHLKPWMFLHNSRHSNLEVLLMPVKV